MSGKTGPNHSMDDGRLISVFLGRCMACLLKQSLELWSVLTRDLDVGLS